MSNDKSSVTLAPKSQTIQGRTVDNPDLNEDGRLSDSLEGLHGFRVPHHKGQGATSPTGPSYSQIGPTKDAAERQRLFTKMVIQEVGKTFCAAGTRVITDTIKERVNDTLDMLKIDSKRIQADMKSYC